MSGCFLLFTSSADQLPPSRLTTVAQWIRVGLQGVRDSKQAAPTVSRALAIMHTCMYDAWAEYDEKAVGTQLSGALRRPPSERTVPNKGKAVSYASYRALSDLLPADTESVYKPLMKELGYDPNNNSTDIETPEGIGNVACAAVLEFRHHDKSNQLGDMQRLDKQDGSLVAGTLAPTAIGRATQLSMHPEPFPRTPLLRSPSIRTTGSRSPTPTRTAISSCKCSPALTGPSSRLSPSAKATSCVPSSILVW